MSSKTMTPVTALACPPGTLAGGPIRTRFFDGMFLTQADLETEQRYWRIKRRLTNRALGDGIVWGLRLEWKQNKRGFALSPGYALDCCGNDLVVECPLEISESQLWTRADPSLKSGDGVVEPAPPPPPSNTNPDTISHGHSHNHTHEGRDTVHACVVLQYVECAEEARPVHRDACAGPTGHCEPSRIRESARLILVPPPTRPPLTPPELFLEELIKWRDSLPADVKAVLFPDGGTPPVAPGTGQVPLSLSVAVGGAPVVVQVPAQGSMSAPVSLSGTQTTEPGRPTGIVTFELLPSSGWHLVAGRVLDASRTVETVTPPASPSMFWSLDVVIPEDPAQPRNVAFDFDLDQIGVKQMFGGSLGGAVTAEVRGTVIVTLLAAGGNQVRVDIDDLIIETKLAEVTEGEGGQGCLRELIPWGWTVDPKNGGKIARVLVLASLYGAMSEVIRRGASANVQALFGMLYGLAWYLLFRVNPVAGPPATDAHRAKLAELILALYKRWCDGFVYPGPRCYDEHHGVYLGCAEISRNGTVQSFDMWRHRRHVLTGPLVNHWAGQFGIAPLDVIAGRFASAICCMSGLPPLTLPAMGNGPNNGVGMGLNGPGGRAMHIGTVSSVTTYASDLQATPRWVSPNEVALRAPAALASSDSVGPFEVYATQLVDGNSIAVAVPQGSMQKPHGGNDHVRLNEEILVMTRRGDFQVREAGRAPVAEFTSGLLKKVHADALVGEQADAATRKVALAATHAGMTAADVADGGTAAVIERTRDNSVETRDGAANLVDAAEAVVDKVVAVVVKTVGPRADRASFARTDNVTKLKDGITKLLPKLPAGTVEAVAKQVAAGS